MKATTIYITDEQKQIFKDIKYLTDKPMNTVMQEILDKHLFNYLEDVKKNSKKR